MLTICYITARKQPLFRWFYDSLRHQCPGLCKDVQLVVVDRYAETRSEEKNWLADLGTNWDWTYPKPSVWYGPHRLTKDEWFDAAGYRNTGLCFAKGDYIVYVDDLSVLLPGWWDRVTEAAKHGYCVCGTYQKMRSMIVENGTVKGYDLAYKAGKDTRAPFAQSPLHKCDGGWLYGCSCGFPVEALLTVNGWDETCAGCGSEDYCTGLRLSNAGFVFMWDKHMVTYESDEHHFAEPPLRKEDWHFKDGHLVIGGNGHTDKSHTLLNNAKGSRVCSNFFPEGGIREVRNNVLKSGYAAFPLSKIPEHDFYTGMALKDL